MRLAAVLFVLAAATTALLAADFAPERVVRLVEAEKFGFVSGLREVARADAAGGQAVALSEDSQVLAMLALPAGDYTFVLRLFAPAGDQDGFFVEINGVRTRRTAPIGRWSNLAFPFRAGGAEPVVLSLIGQEPGLLADRLAVVKGTVTDDAVDLRTLAAAALWRAPGSPCARIKRVGEPGASELRRLQVPPPRLLPLDRHEQRLEVPHPEPAAAVPLDDLEEQRRAVLHRLREDL